MRKRPAVKTVISLGLLVLLAASPTITAPSPASAVAATVTFDPATLNQFGEIVQARANAPKPPVYANSYLLLDAQTATTIVAKNAEMAVPIASTTKMATALVARELFALDQLITVKKEVALIPGSDIQLRTGEQLTVHDLLRGLLIQSGNDAAFALAYAYGGDSPQPFVDKMNQFARDHHLLHSHYGDPAGLDDENGRSTAADLAHTARLLLNDPVLAKIVATPSAIITSADGQAHELKNSNRLVVGDSGLYMPSVTGVKTGFTPAAGHCLVSSYRLGDRLLIGVVLNTHEYTITASASEMKKLFTWAESNVVTSNY